MWHNHIVPFFVENPSMAIFLTLCLGYLVGKLKYKMLTLGTVTSVLLVGVVIGILMPDLKILPPLKMVFFLLFLFAIGYSVGPQFFRSFKKQDCRRWVLPWPCAWFAWCAHGFVPSLPIIMQVKRLAFSPEHKPYRQLLALARKQLTGFT